MCPVLTGFKTRVESQMYPVFTGFVTRVESPTKKFGLNKIFVFDRKVLHKY